MSAHYSDYATYWDNHARNVGAEAAVTGLGDKYAEVIGAVLKQVAPDSVIDILDLGCGAGLTYPVTKALWFFSHYVGCDISVELIEYCRKTYPGVEFKVLGGASIPEGDDWIDLVICHSVFTHMYPDDVMEYLLEIHRVLTPVGRASVSIHTDTDMNWQGGIARMDYKPSYFEGMLEDAGLTIYNRIPGNQLVYGVGK